MFLNFKSLMEGSVVFHSGFNNPQSESILPLKDLAKLRGQARDKGIPVFTTNKIKEF